jgi:hypothetical protein
MIKVKEKIVMDIEAMDTQLLDYQKLLWDKISKGFKAGEMSIISAGRQTGKSYFDQLYMKNQLNQFYGTVAKIAPFTLLTSAQVDGVTWYTVVCDAEVSAWVRAHKSENWYEHPGTLHYKSTFDVSEKIHTLMRVGFSA